MMHREFVEAGHKVFGLHAITDGACQCGNPDCKAIGKHPIISNWSQIPEWDDEQLNTFEQLGWFDTGYGVLVDELLIVDVDARNGGVESHARLLDAVPELAGCGFVVATGSGNGSKHLYFRAPAGASLVQHHHGYPGIDFKSSGYVVGPGSLHASGNRYDVLMGSIDDVNDAPAALIDLLKRPDAHRVKTDSGPVDVDDAQLVEMVSAIDPDCPYDEWVRVGMAIHQITGGTGRHIWEDWSEKGSKCVDNKGANSIDAKWHSFGKSFSPVGYGTLCKMAEEGGWVEPVTFDYKGEIEPDPEPDPDQPLQPDKPRHQRWLDSLLEPRIGRVKRFSSRPWLIKGVLPIGSVASLVGASGAGKSFCAVDIACSVASGQPWAGHEVREPCGVVYVSAEGGSGIDKRVVGWAQHHGADDVPDVRMILDAPIMDNDKDVMLVVATLQELARRVERPPRLIILDTLNRVMEGEENSATAMGALMRGIGRLQHEVNCAVLIAHHSGHGEKGRARGSSAYYAALDAEMTVHSKGAELIEIECTKSKDAEPFRPALFVKKQVTLDGITNIDGEPVTTLVLDPHPGNFVDEGAQMNAITDKDALAIIDYMRANGITQCGASDGRPEGSGALIGNVREAFREHHNATRAASGERTVWRRAWRILIEAHKAEAIMDGQKVAAYRLFEE